MEINGRIMGEDGQRMENNATVMQTKCKINLQVMQKQCKVVGMVRKRH